MRARAVDRASLISSPSSTTDRGPRRHDVTTSGTMSGDDYFLYAATAYFGLNAAVFSCAPAMPATDSFGPEAAECAPLPRRGDRPPRPWPRRRRPGQPASAGSLTEAAASRRCCCCCCSRPLLRRNKPLLIMSEVTGAVSSTPQPAPPARTLLPRLPSQAGTPPPAGGGLTKCAAAAAFARADDGDERERTQRLPSAFSPQSRDTALKRSRRAGRDDGDACERC